MLRVTEEGCAAPPFRRHTKNVLHDHIENKHEQRYLTQHAPPAPVMLWPTSSSLRRPQWLIILPCFVFLLLVPLLVFRTAAFQRLDTWLSHSTRPQKAAAAPPSDTVETGSPQTTTNGSPQNETTQSEFYEWRTRSAFRPVRQSGVADKSVEELCASFPKHLLDEVQPALKTGHGVIDSRVRPQLQSVSACLTNLLIFSDLDEECEGHQVIDVIADLPADHIEDNDQLGYYRSLRDLTANGSLAEADAVSRKGWQIDKFKFLAAVSRAWRMRPERRWYVFYEADTYMVWDNMFRLLENFDPDTPLYFGSPSPGRDDMWFGNGGPGYVISREAMRRLVKYDWDAMTGEYQGSKLTERHWDELMHNCCGDSVVGWALWTEKVKLSGLWPMFNPHPPHGVPFSDLYWCQPVITMHKPHEDDILGLWRWQWEHRELTVC